MDFNSLLKDLQNDDFLNNVATLNQLEKSVNIPSYPNPTQLKISNLSSVCSINTKISDPRAISYLAPIISSDREIGIDNTDYLGIHRTNKPINKSKRKNRKKKKRFVNQFSVNIRIRPDKVVNLKVFINGRITLTGLKRKEDGPTAINIFIKICKDMYNTMIIKNRGLDELMTSYFDKKKHYLLPVDISNNMKIRDFKVTLINSNFSANFNIKRDVIFQILRDKYHINNIKYEPIGYPGVNVKYMYNEDHNNDGVCKCTLLNKDKCTCRRISMFIFRTGKIIITGARKEEQLNEAYNFINTVLKRHYHEIVRVNLKDFIRKKIVIKKKVPLNNTTLFSPIVLSMSERCDRTYMIFNNIISIIRIIWFRIPFNVMWWMSKITATSSNILSFSSITIILNNIRSISL